MTFIVERLPCRRLAVKLGLLGLLILYYLYPATVTFASTNVQSPIVQHPDAHITRGDSSVAAITAFNIGQYYQVKGTVDAAKLLLRPHRPRSLTPQEGNEKNSTAKVIPNFSQPNPDDIDCDGFDVNYLDTGYIFDDCLPVWGSKICNPLLQLWDILGGYIKTHNMAAKINPRGKTKASTQPDDIPKYTQPIPDDLLNSDDVDHDITMDECLQLMEPLICEALLDRLDDNLKRQDLAAEVNPRSQWRDHRCKKNPFSRHCRERLIWLPLETADLASHPHQIPKVVERMQFPRWQNETKNTTAVCGPMDRDRFVHTSIEDRMRDNCTPKSQIIRTWIDSLLPPEECANYPRGSPDLNRCLYVSDNQSPLTIGTYVAIGIVGTCTLGLIMLACIRRRRRRMSPLLKDPERLKGAAPPKYFAETRSLESNGPGFDGFSRRYSDIPPYHNVGTTLDGANDGWTKWILRRNHNDQKRCVPPPRTSAPRIPSLKLPKPTFATMRRASGLEPDNYSRLKPRTSKQTSRLLRWGSNL